MASPEAVPLKVVSDMFGLVQNTVVEMIERGELRGRRLGRNWRITTSSIDDLRQSMGMPRIYDPPCVTVQISQDTLDSINNPFEFVAVPTEKS